MNTNILTAAHNMADAVDVATAFAKYITDSGYEIWTTIVPGIRYWVYRGNRFVAIMEWHGSTLWVRGLRIGLQKWDMADPQVEPSDVVSYLNELPSQEQ